MAHKDGRPGVGFSETWSKILRMFGGRWWCPKELWIRLKLLVWYRHRVVKPRYLGYLWEEYDVVLAHAMFEVLSRFLEEDCSIAFVDWYAENTAHKVTIDGKEKYVIDEIKELYAWWHDVYNKEYPAQLAAIEKELDEHEPIEQYREDQGRKIWDRQYASEEDEEKARTVRNKFFDLEQRMEDELNARLHRIINIRGSLWT